MPYKILIVDDDEAVMNLLMKVVRGNQYHAFAASTGEAALDMLDRDTFDLILLDINLGGIDGFEVLKRIREKGINTPVMIISGRKEEFDTTYGLDIGADYYVVKPFNPITLGAKMKALLRRAKGLSGGDIISAGPFKYNASTLRFYKNGSEIFLSSKENALIKLFMDNVDRIFPKSSLYELVWGDTIVDDNTIMVYINRLRKKIEDEPNSPQYIQTVRGLGYRFVV